MPSINVSSGNKGSIKVSGTNGTTNIETVNNAAWYYSELAEKYKNQAGSYATAAATSATLAGEYCASTQAAMTSAESIISSTTESSLNTINSVGTSYTNTINSIGTVYTDNLNSIGTSYTSSINSIGTSYTSTMTDLLSSTQASATYASIWAEGTDEEVEELGGTHSAKEWVDYILENAPLATVTQTETGATLEVHDINGTTTATILNGATGATGSTGAAGTDGFSPLVTVTKSGTTAIIECTDKNGTTTATVSDGVGTVASVNGYIGSVVLTATDVGALPNTTTITDLATTTQMQAINSGITASDVSVIAANTSAISTKQDTLIQGSNITISGNTISATDTTYTNGTGLNLSGNTFSVDFTEVATASQGSKADSALQTISSSDVTTALGYTPYDSSNPNGYTSNTGTVTSVNNVSPVNGNVTLSIPSVDSALSTTSENPVQNKVINTALDSKQDVLTAGTDLSINTITSGKNKFDVVTMGTDMNVSLFTDNYIARLANNSGVIVPILPNTTYTVSTSAELTVFRIATYPTIIPYGESVRANAYVKQTNNNPITFTSTANDHYLYIQVNTALFSTAITTLQVEEGTTATTYTAYQNTPSTVITFTNDTGYANNSDVIKKSGGSTSQTISLTSGTGTTALGVKSASTTSSYISFTSASAWLGSIGVNSSKQPVFYNGTGYTLAYTSDIPTIATSVSASSTNAETVGAKLFYDTCGDIETLINAL